MRLARKIIYISVVDSTNNYAAKLNSTQNLANGTAILAGFQTGGMGQRGSSWESLADENILCSFIISSLSLNIDDQFYISMAVCLAVNEVLKKSKIKSQIKWPNDVYVKNKKIAGILISNTISSEKVSNSIIGIGLNVNQKNFSLESATSMNLESGKNFDLTVLMLEITEKLEQYLTQLTLGNIAYIKDSYLKNLKGFHEKLKFSAQNKVFIGKIVDVNSQGHLCIECLNAMNELIIISYDMKEVKFIFD